MGKPLRRRQETVRPDRGESATLPSFGRLAVVLTAIAPRAAASCRAPVMVQASE